MKDIRPALRTYLLADPIISGLVGGQRIHPTRLPQELPGEPIMPAVVLIKVSETGDYHMLSDSGLAQMRMQVDAWGQKADQATELANVVYDRLSGAREIINYDSDFVNLRGAFVINGRDDYDEIAKLYRNSRDYILWYGASE